MNWKEKLIVCVFTTLYCFFMLFKRYNMESDKMEVIIIWLGVLVIAMILIKKGIDYIIKED